MKGRESHPAPRGNFNDALALWPDARIAALGAAVTPAAVEAALVREERTPADLAALLSPAARPYLEPMAREAQRLTRRFFGRTISLYAPLYLSNLCAADCVYCGFSVRAPTQDKRLTLKPAAIRQECAALARQGFQSVLLLTGEAPRVVPVPYIAAAITIAREYFASVAIEVYALDAPGYRALVEAGLEGVTLYMETYDRPAYAAVHLEGEKADYDFRLGAIERAGAAGARKISIGVLLGLAPWRTDIFRLGIHARYLQKHCWDAALSLSFPRLIHTPARFQLRDRVDDADLVQIMLAMRLFLPEAGFNLSTRETPALRDRLLPLGVTAMSAGSSTRPGGYATYPARAATGNDRLVLEQFEIEDDRSPHEIEALIRRAGYDPIWKDFDSAYVG